MGDAWWVVAGRNVVGALSGDLRATRRGSSRIRWADAARWVSNMANSRGVLGGESCAVSSQQPG